MQNKYYIFAVLGIIIITTMSIINSNKAHVIGKVTWEQWVEFSGWKIDVNLKGGDSYDFDKNIVKELNEILAHDKSYSFVLFSGSWCGDSRIEMPNIIDLINHLELNDSQFEIIGVSRDKTEPRQYIQKYGMEYVPTLIILHNSKEIGRLIESTEKTWEEDILDIIQKHQ